MKMLFIGGSQDGEYIDVPNRMIWEIPVQPCLKDGVESATTAPAGMVERYRRVSISLCDMMLVDHMSVGEVIPRLMDCYRPEVKS